MVHLLDLSVSYKHVYDLSVRNFTCLSAYNGALDVSIVPKDKFNRIS
jgi:hypothetical protein